MRAPISLVGFLILLLGVSPTFAQDAQTFFDDNCAMCHSIGGEPASGPDLEDITKRRDRLWLVRFIHDPQEAAEHDREAAALVKQYDDAMPPSGASTATIEAVLRYIEEKSGDPTSAEASSAAAITRPVTAADLLLGRELYEGRRPFANGAPGCVSCHQLGSIEGLGGGALGPDLTGVHQKLGGTVGLSSWMGNPPTKVMRAIYRKAALTEEETHALVAFLGDSAAVNAPPKASTRPAFFMIGVIGFFLVLVIMGAAWSGRFRSVRQPLVARSRVHAGGQR
jgi:mono/diheme cytochrome c family protein